MCEKKFFFNLPQKCITNLLQKPKTKRTVQRREKKNKNEISINRHVQIIKLKEKKSRQKLSIHIRKNYLVLQKFPLSFN